MDDINTMNGHDLIRTVRAMVDQAFATKKMELFMGRNKLPATKTYSKQRQMRRNLTDKVIITLWSSMETQTKTQQRQKHEVDLDLININIMESIFLD